MKTRADKQLCWDCKNACGNGCCWFRNFDNDQRAREARITAQIISIIVPLCLLALVGAVVILIRKKRYTQKL